MTKVTMENEYYTVEITAKEKEGMTLPELLLMCRAAAIGLGYTHDTLEQYMSEEDLINSSM